jgi:hypothetical protein
VERKSSKKNADIDGENGSTGINSSFESDLSAASGAASGHSS